MQYEKLVPSRELCEEMARLGICQDGAELWWNEYSGGLIGECWQLEPWKATNAIIAPTLARMMEELPQCLEVYKGIDDVWHCWIEEPNLFLDIADKHIPNAVAKALIAIKKGKV